MSIDKSLESKQLERHFLSGLFSSPEVFPDIDIKINENDFVYTPHKKIYGVVKSFLIKGEPLDKVLIAQRIESLGCVFQDQINIYDYIENITFNKVNASGVIKAAEELIKLRVRRDLVRVASTLSDHAQNSNSEDVSKLIQEADSIYNSKVSMLDLNCKNPENIFSNLKDVILERAENPLDEFGLTTPFSEFNRLFGGLRPKNLYAIASRPGQGKSTFLNHMCLYTSQLNNVEALYLDTEMSTVEQQYRMAANISGVPLWYIETGKWKSNPDYVSKINKAFEKMEKFKYYHYEVGNKNIDQVISIIRRWYLSQVGRGKRCLIVYDYIKLTGEKTSASWSEHQLIGDKVDKLKKIAEEIDSPIFTAIQMNRSGETQNRRSDVIIDDSSAIALSDRLQWFASFVALFRRKTADEIALDGVDHGTHKLLPVKTRFQGRDSAGHQDLLKRKCMENVRGEPSVIEKWVTNYINFSVDNFEVKEKGSLKDVINKENEIFDLNNQESAEEVL